MNTAPLQLESLSSKFVLETEVQKRTAWNIKCK